MSQHRSDDESTELPTHRAEEPTVGRPLNAPARRPLGKVLAVTVLVFVVLVVLYLAAVQWLVD